MSINIQLAQRQNVFTNLDVISGRVVLSLSREESFSAINVKLEGESRTRLAHPLGTRSGDRGETELEVHKLLYNVAVVFPTHPVFGAKAYTLPPGHHEFPFSFKIPFNNACNPYNIKKLNVAGLSLDMRDNNHHVKRTLPPTLSGFPGEAEIKYFVKVTAERPSFLKENFRAQVLFKFLPIEPPRPPVNSRETYGRRKHQFASPSGLVGRPGLFRKQVPDTAAPPLVSVDARLPDPAILTCDVALPLRVLITKLNNSPESIFLRTFHVTLWAHTKIRAHELERVEVTSWVLCSYANMMERLRTEGADQAGATRDGGAGASASSPTSPSLKQENGGDLYPMLIPSRLWANHPIPSSVPPSFQTCNLSRWYELEISVGLSWGSPGSIRPELTVQPIRLPVDVYSGIAPSPALISAANAAAAQQQQQNMGRPPAQPPRPGGGVVAPTAVPVQSPGPSSVDPGAAGPASAQAATIPAPPYDEPPPSYEDAMAEDLAPVDGPRRDYQVVDSAPVTDDKRRR